VPDTKWMQLFIAASLVQVCQKMALCDCFRAVLPALMVWVGLNFLRAVLGRQCAAAVSRRVRPL
jgi:hypothetical protein